MKHLRITIALIISFLLINSFLADVQAEVESYGMDYREMSQLLREASKENELEKAAAAKEIFLKLAESPYMNEELKNEILKDFTSGDFQNIQKKMLHASFIAVEAALKNSDIEAAKQWYEIRETKLKFDRDAPGLKAMVELQNSPDKIGQLTPIILTDLRDTYLFKLKEALAHEGDVEEANAYFQIIRKNLQENLGEEKVASLNKLLEKDSLTEAEISALNEMLNQYAAKQISPETVQSHSEQIIQLLSYIERNWTIAIKEGQIFNAVEFSELKAFITEAKQRILQIRPAFPVEGEELEQKIQFVESALMEKKEQAEIQQPSQELISVLAEKSGINTEELEKQISDDPDTAKKASFALLDQALEKYKLSNIQEASDLVFKAYFAFEPLEAKLMVKDEAAVAEIEKKFAHIRSSLKSGKEIDGQMDELKAQIGRAVLAITAETTGWELFVQSLMIILREGFEAILIIGALAAYMVKTNQRSQARYIYIGSVAALVASVASAYLIRNLLKLSGSNQEALEGITMLIAVGVLFYVSYWLISKVQGRKWQQFIQGKLQESVSKGNLYTMGLVAFLAVYREGFETILFYQALLSLGDDNSMVLYGLLVGALLLTVLYYAISKFSIKIPIKPFFMFTSILLYLMAFSFAGHGIFELQEAGMVPSTYLASGPSLTIIGIYPTVETLAAQSLLIMALLIAAGAFFLKKVKTAEKIEVQ